MTTLALLKAAIARDLDAEDGYLDDDIAQEIATAIGYFKSHRFYFNERRSLTFSTVAAQANYGTADNPAIPDLVQVDQVHCTVSGSRRVLCRSDFYDLEPLYDDSAATGEPTRWAYYNRELWLYPVPDQAYTVRVLGLYKVAGPATDDEPDNPWMTEAFELLRYRVRALVAGNRKQNPQMAAAALQMEADALQNLRVETARRVGTGVIRGDRF